MIRALKNLWFYEIGKTFFIRGTSDFRNTGVEEIRVLAGALTGNIASGKWHVQKEIDFYELKGKIEVLFDELGLENRIEYQAVSDISYLHPGRSAAIRLLGKDKVVIGTFGELHPDTQERCKLSQPVYIFEINLEKVFSALTYTIPRYKELPLYPAVHRDIAFIIPRSINNQSIVKAIKKIASNLTKTVEIFDVYQGKNIAEGHKSLAYRLTLQDPDATLTDDRIDAEITKLKEGLKKTYPEISFRDNL